MTDKKGPLPLEPEAILLCDASTQLCHMVSIAISLKRIADALHDAGMGGASDEARERYAKSICWTADAKSLEALVAAACKAEPVA